MNSSKNPSFNNKLIAISLATLGMIIAAGAALFAYNQLLQIQGQLQPASSRPTSDAEPATTPDDSAALENLSMTLGAIFSYVEKSSPDDCMFLIVATDQLAGSTPLESYRGRYEGVEGDLRVITSLCAMDPLDSVAIESAVRVRRDVAEILNERKFMGLEWGEPEPVPGKQR